MGDSDNMLSLLESYLEPSDEEVARTIADDFRRRRVEKGLTREAVAELAGVVPANVARFEQKGLISLKNLIRLAAALGYTGELQGVFATPKYATMDELTLIRRNTGKKRARACKQ